MKCKRRNVNPVRTGAEGPCGSVRRRRPCITHTLSVLVMIGLSACEVGPRYHKPQVNIEPEYGELKAHASTGPSHQGHGTNAELTTPEQPAVEWWRIFGDAELNRLIADALRQNLRLQLASARLREARFQRSIVAADLLPNLDADAGYLRARGSRNVVLPLGGGGAGGASSATGSGGAANASKGRDLLIQNGGGAGDASGGGGAGGGASGATAGSNRGTSNPDQLTPFGKGGLPGQTSSLYQIGFDSSWELDIFGGNRRRLEAAAADIGASVEALHDVTVALLAEVARNYLELRGEQRRLAVARQNLADQRVILELTRSRNRAGLSTEADVARAAAQVATTSAVIPPLETSVRRSIHLLSTLLAQPPNALAATLETVQPLPLPPPTVPVGLPSELIRRRPDIRQAERQIAAATARIGAAKADLFPKFALTGSVGLDSTAPESLFNFQSHYFLISPTVTWRIFDAGRIVSTIALQKAVRSASLVQYRDTILTALREVEDALVAYAQEHEHRDALVEAERQNREALRLTRDQYEHGLATFIDVLDAQRSVLQSQDQLAQSEEAIDTDLVALYKALGGGWELADAKK